MKLTKSQLKQLIKEELLEVLSREDARVMATFSPTYHEKAGPLQADQQSEERRMQSLVDAGRITQEAYDNFVARIAQRYEGDLEEIKDEIADAFIERSEQPGAKYQNISDWASAHADSLLNMMRMGHKNLPDWLDDLLMQKEVDPEVSRDIIVRFLKEQVLKQIIKEEFKKDLEERKKKESIKSERRTRGRSARQK